MLTVAEASLPGTLRLSCQGCDLCRYLCRPKNVPTILHLLMPRFNKLAACILSVQKRPLFFQTYLIVQRGLYTAAMRIAIYSRVSTSGQDTANQLVQLRAFAANQGWTVIKEFVDIASGKNGDRQQFKALFAAASRREFDSVLFWSLDRFSREGVFETLQYLQRLTGHGVGYRSFTEQYLDTRLQPS